MYLYDFVLKYVEEEHVHQSPDGSMPPGCNGPYGDRETPVRNTSHWLILFVKAYEITNDKRFLNCARRAIEYLLSGYSRPNGFSFYHRYPSHKDTCNGLIGQAWTIEALSYAYSSLQDERCLRTAESVFEAHPFKVRTGVWNRLEPDGRVLSIDPTFNHQLWFAAAGSLLPSSNHNIQDAVLTFLDTMDKKLFIHPNGLIDHPLIGASRQPIVFKWLAQFLNKQNEVQEDGSKNAKLWEKNIGYHAFNLYAFAMLKQSFPNHSFWRSDNFSKILHFSNTESFKDELKNNKFGYKYNLTGFEMAFALHVLKPDAIHDQKEWIERQIHYAYHDQLSENQTPIDRVTHIARLYEVMRVPNRNIETMPCILS